MSIMDMFKNLGQGAQQQQQQQPVQTSTNNPAGVQPQPGQQQPNNSFQPPAGQTPPAEVSPLDQFNDLWKTNPDAQANDFNPGNIFQMDPAKIQQALQQVDFTKSIEPTELQAVAAGGEGAVAALASILNKASRETMGAATTATAKMIETAMSKAQGSLDSKITSQVKLQQVSAQLQENNPALSHPAVAPMVELMKQQFTQKYPTASPAEISQLATKYVTEMGNAFAGKPAATQETSGAGETDWGSYLFGPGNN